MSWAEMNKMGYAKIIVDTSTMSVGDKVRVKSVFNPTQYLDKQVATVGTPLIFDLGFIKDYIKICIVQTISDVETEIGGVYRTVDYGQTLFINVLDKTTLGGIQGILNAHQEGSQLAIGDEVSILVGGSDWIMQVANIDTTNHAVDYVSKNIYSMISTTIDYTSSNLRTTAQAFYNSIDSSDKQYIKQVTRTCRNNPNIKTYSDYVWVAGIQETAGNDWGCGQTQFPIFVTQASRIKTFNGTAEYWWTDDSWDSNKTASIGSTGAYSSEYSTYQLGFVPCFRLTADS